MLGKRKVVAVAAVAAAIGVSCRAVADEPYVIGLGNLPGGSWSEPWAVSDDGRVVVGYARSSGGNREAFRWTIEEGMVGLGFLPSWDGGESWALDVSADGSVVVGTSTSEATYGLEAFRWTPETGMVGLGTLPGWDMSQGLGVSGDGLVAVGVGGDYPTTFPFRWTEADGMVRLEGTPRGWASGVSPDGSVIVGQGKDDPGNPVAQAFRWTAGGGTTFLGNLPGMHDSMALATSDDGGVVVGGDENWTEPFRWTETEGMVGLGLLPGGAMALAWDVSGDGSVIVGDGMHHEGGRWRTDGFIWTAATGIRDLHKVVTCDLGLELDGWRVIGARGISADGRYIAATGAGPSFPRQAVLIYLGDPIPCKGDLNGDGLRDLQDLITLLSSYGVDAGGDIDGDGDTDLSDLAWFLAVYGQPCLQW